MSIDLAIQEGIYAVRARKEMIARIKFEQVTEIAPQSAEAWLWLAWSSVCPSDVVDHLRKANELEPDNQLISKFMEVARALTVLDAGQLRPTSTQQTANTNAASTVQSREERAASDVAKPPQKAAASTRPPVAQVDKRSPKPNASRKTDEPRQPTPKPQEPATAKSTTKPAEDDHKRDEFQKAASAFAQVAETAKANLAEERELMDEETETQIQEMAADIQEIGDEIEHHQWQDSAETDTYFDPAKSTILVVDDSPTIRKTLTILLQAEGYNVITAEDGVEATQLLVNSFPNLILLDINMPRMSGYRLCKLIKAHPDTSIIPVIMISGSVLDRLRCSMVGCDDYISKPFETDVLLERVRQHMNIAISNATASS